MLLANKCLCDSLTIQNELKKLIDYANGREVTLQMVEDIISDYYNVDAFAFAKAVVSMNGQLSIKILHELFALRTEPIAILGAVSKSFIDLYRVKTALINGRNERDILEDFDYARREFVVRNYIRDERKIRLEHVRDCIRILAQTSIDLVSYSVDGKILLEKAVAEMINSGYKYY
jgi:DNA polymerase-3 subunit delta